MPYIKREMEHQKDKEKWLVDEVIDLIVENELTFWQAKVLLEKVSSEMEKMKLTK